MTLSIIKANNNTVRTKEITTVFNDGVGLDTSDKKDAHFYPKSFGKYVQSFDGDGIERQWARHIEAENYLMDTGGCELIEQDFLFEAAFNEEVDNQVAHIKSLPMWYLKGAYWYYIRRRLWANKTVEKQHKKGMVQLPNERV